MSQSITQTSSVKVAWSFCWAAFWTGFPFKMIATLLLLAMEIHPWEGHGLVALCVISIPIDIWALGLTAKTYFLDRYGIEAKGPVGITLWWQGAIVGGLFAVAGYFVISATASKSQSIAASIIEFVKRSIYPHLPIAEQITIELMLWATPTVIVGAVLALIALTIYGWRIKTIAGAMSQPTTASLVERVRRWDLDRVPTDAGALLGSLGGAVVVLTVVFWVVMPVTTPHPHPDFLPPVVKPVKQLKPEELLKQTDVTLAKAEAVLQTLEDGKMKEAEKKVGKPKDSKANDAKAKEVKAKDIPSKGVAEVKDVKSKDTVSHTTK